jgi:oligopeptidase B
MKKTSLVQSTALLLLIANTMICCDFSKKKDEENEKEAIMFPVAEKRPTITTVHDFTLTDDYHWLRERENPEVIAYLEAENKYAKSIMAHTKTLQERIFNEMKGRLIENDESVPVKKGNYYYYYRTQEGLQYPIYCRKRGNLQAKEEIILDVNQLADTTAYFSLGAFEVSPDHLYLAYSTDTDGSEKYTLYIKNLITGELTEDRVPEISSSIAWANDSQTLFYTIHDHAKRPFKVFKHKLGHHFSEDMQVFHEEDDRFFVNVSRSANKQLILIHAGSKTTSEVHYVSANQPDENLKLFSKRKNGVKYHIFPHENEYYVLTNFKAINYRLMKTPVVATNIKSWQEVISHNPNRKIETLDVFADYLAIYEREDGLRKIRIMDLKKRNEFYIDFPDPVYTINKESNPDFNEKNLRFSYSSLIRPLTTFQYNMSEQERISLKEEKVEGGYDFRNYKVERIFATAQDSTKIPVSLVYKKGLVKDGTNPVYLHSYGSYGSSMDPNFKSSRLSLIDRGFIYAMAHIRGGSDMGEEWYENGKLNKKKNSFTDFIACAEHLIKEKYTNKDKIAAMGGSAGGLLMGAVANMRPDLFKVMVAHVPFVDVANTMLDPSLPLTITEYDEWGNPNEKDAFEYILSYSPYDNVKAQNYPNMLITAGLNDPRVSYWEPAKWTAKLRSLKTDNNKIILKTNMEAGHSGSSGRYNYLKETAFEYAFILDVLGISEK